MIDLLKLTDKFQERKDPLEFEVLYFFLLTLEIEHNISKEIILSSMNEALIEWDCSQIKLEEVSEE